VSPAHAVQTGLNSKGSAARWSLRHTTQLTSKDARACSASPRGVSLPCMIASSSGHPRRAKSGKGAGATSIARPEWAFNDRRFRIMSSSEVLEGATAYGPSREEAPEAEAALDSRPPGGRSRERGGSPESCVQDPLRTRLHVAAPKCVLDHRVRATGLGAIASAAIEFELLVKALASREALAFLWRELVDHGPRCVLGTQPFFQLRLGKDA